MRYETLDKIIGWINLADPKHEGCGPQGTALRIEINENYVQLYIGPRCWQWDRETGIVLGCNTASTVSGLSPDLH